MNQFDFVFQKRESEKKSGCVGARVGVARAHTRKRRKLLTSRVS